MMRIFILALALFFVQSNAQAATHQGAKVKTMQSPDARPCTFFWLEGVGVADSTIKNSPWFAVPRTHLGHDVIISMLLTSLTTGKELDVHTTGGAACSHAAVSHVTFSYN